MDVAGFSDGGSELIPPHATMFDQSELGDPALARDKFRALENRVLELLDPGLPLTFSTEGTSYMSNSSATVKSGKPVIRARRLYARLGPISRHLRAGEMVRR